MKKKLVASILSLAVMLQGISLNVYAETDILDNTIAIVDISDNNVQLSLKEGEQIQLDFKLDAEQYDLNDVQFLSKNMNNNVYVTNTGKLIGCNSGEDEITVFVRNLITHLEDTFKLSVTVEMSDQISAKNRDEIKRLNGMSNCDFCRRKMELLGVIGEDSPRLTMEKLQEFIADSNNNHELLAKVMNYVEYPDLISDSGNRNYDFWLDSNGNEVITIGYEQNFAAYTKIADDGIITGGQMLYPEKTEFTENGKDTSFEYNQYHQIKSEGKGSVTLAMIDETNGEPFSEANGKFQLVEKIVEDDGTVSEKIVKSWNIFEGNTITIDGLLMNHSYILSYADEYHEDKNGNKYKYEIDTDKGTHIYSFASPKEYSFNVYLIKHYITDPVLIKGDVNGDEEFNIADVVLFQRWLLGYTDTELSVWTNGNFCEDDVLNSFDLCLMKQNLFKTNK